jgi:hypothetical protein
MPPRAARLLLLALPFAAVPAQAGLGETLDDLRKRFGPPVRQEQPQKGTEMWFIETELSHRLVYTVTFNAQGRSIAEGLKPVRRAVMTAKHAQDFIDSQLEMHRTAATTRAVKPGEQYAFAKQVFTCGEDEAVLVDEAQDFMIVWNKGPQPLVLAVRAEMLAPKP